MFPFIIQGSNIVVVVDNKPHTISKAHISFEKVKEAIKASDWELVRELVEPAKAILHFSKGSVEIRDGVFYWKGKEFHNALATRIIEMFKEGFNITPMVNFMERLSKNPSNRAVNELYGFLEKCNLPITEDGYFLAYKRIRRDWKDCHSGSIDNSIGQVVEMERNAVNDNSDQTCSHGLHFCSISYLGHFGGDRTVILKIDPADVVSIPRDYNDAKGRCCRYQVIGEIENDATAHKQAFTSVVQNNAVNTIAKIPEPVKAAGPKLVTTAFGQGYEDGFNSKSYNPPLYAVNYDEGFTKGHADKVNGVPQKYTTKRGTFAPWPFAR